MYEVDEIKMKMHFEIFQTTKEKRFNEEKINTK